MDRIPRIFGSVSLVDVDARVLDDRRSNVEVTLVSTRVANDGIVPGA